MREEILEITRTQQYIDSQPMPMQLGANPKSEGKGKDSKGKGKDVKGKDKGKDAKNESSKKATSDDQRKGFFCQKTGHVKGPSAESDRKTLPMHRGETDGSVATRHSSGRAVAMITPQGERHTSTFVIAMPCANSETLCESSTEQAVKSPGAGSIAPVETTTRETHSCDSVK